MSAAFVQAKPFNHAFAITPADGADITVPGAEIFVKVAGDLKITTVGGDTVTLAVPVGHLPVAVSRVFSTGTTATGISGIYRS